MKSNIAISGHDFYCPICNRNYTVSNYLKETFKDNTKSLWFANMVTHYRHEHITSWNKCWGHNGNYYRSKWFVDYDNEKSKVNERAKRQIIRKAFDFMVQMDFQRSDLLLLKGNEKETIELFDKKFTIK